jgi:RNase H-like domain found in reverse transcriptase/Reverse transcriptase (RNA-dependent DNA polymerase)/Integrase zinc binding domain/Retroviral aspartyl protease/Chromo (CHRromatin Organisation MOdifier) domain/DNA N-6-adenine-methyltransferase (Dam)
MAQGQNPQAPKPVRDCTDWRFSRHLFLQLNAEYGPFTVDACCDDLGANAHVASKYFCPSRSFLLSDVAAETVWLNPPFSQGLDFLQHYLKCKAHSPARTSAVILLPDWPDAPWSSLVANMQLVHTYPARSKSLFTRPPSHPAAASKPVGPLPWAVHVYYDPPQAPAGALSAHVSSASASAGSLLTFEGTINGKTARVMVDSGATHNFIGSTFVKLTKMPTCPVFATKVHLADGSLHSTIRRCVDLELEIEQYATRCDFLVTHLEGHDLILGMQWLQAANPAIDFQAQTLTVDGLVLHGNGKPSPPQIQLLDARTMFRSLRGDSNDDVFITTLQVMEEVSEPHPLQPATDQSAEWTTQLHQLLSKHNTVFEEPCHLPDPRPYDHTIELVPGAKPPQQRTARMSPLELEEVQRQLGDYLAKGWIQPSSSPFGAPILFARKKDGTLRMCIDYRALNLISVKNRYPLPRVDELLDQLQGSAVFSALDLWSGYHQVRIHPDDIHKTAFRTRHGHFEFTVLPFGLTNAPATFMGMMNDVLRPFLDKFVVVYLDDILIYSKSLPEHLDHLEQVLATLKQHKLQVKLKKCSFGKVSVPFLGFLVTKEGIRPDPAKVRAVQDWPVPTNVTEVRSFLGFTGFCRRFIRDYARIALPLTHLTRSDVPFPTQLTSAQLAAFAALKLALTSAPLLLLPRLGPDQDFVLYTDASQLAVGAVLLQDQGQGLQPIAYESRKLSPAEVNYPVSELELLAIVHSLRVFRCYLEGCREFTIFTDHDTLKYFMTQKTLTNRKARWQELVAPYAPNMVIKYRKGSENRADALSRMPEVATLSALTATLGSDQGFLKSLREAYTADTYYTPTPPKFVTKADDVFYVGTRLCVPRSLATQLLREYHDSPAGGHLGFSKTIAALTSKFWWPHMSRSVRAYVTSCGTCQRTKPSQQKPAGLLCPLPIAEQPWAQVSLDLITDLPSADGFDSIVVFVDTFTKMAHFVPTNKTVSAQQLALLFIRHVYRLHGLPQRLISDRDPRILSDFFASLFKRLGTTLAPSTAYHPQTDGQTKRTNRTLEQILRAYVHPLHDDWPSHLPLVEFVYNNSIQTSTTVSPFFANYGFKPFTPADVALASSEPPSSSPSGQDLLSRIRDTQTLVAAQLQLAQARMKAYADASRRELAFQVGDLVKLNTKNIKIAGQLTRKFKDRFIGPFPVEAVVSAVSYKLTLPAAIKIHPVFHVSLLNPWNEDAEHPAHIQPDRPVPFASDEIRGDDVFTVDAIVDVKIGLDPSNRGKTLLFLVHWLGYPPSEATWEPYRHVSQISALDKFLADPLWASFRRSPSFAAFWRRYAHKLPLDMGPRSAAAAVADGG